MPGPGGIHCIGHLAFRPVCDKNRLPRCRALGWPWRLGSSQAWLALPQAWHTQAVVANVCRRGKRAPTSTAADIGQMLSEVAPLEHCGWCRRQWPAGTSGYR